MTRRVWGMTHGNDGFKVSLDEVKWWVAPLESTWEFICKYTGGWAGGHGMPGWLWSVPVGFAKWDRSDPDEPFLTNSIAGKFSALEQWALGVGYTKGTKRLASVPVEKELGIALWNRPEDSFLWDDDEDETTA